MGILNYVSYFNSIQYQKCQNKDEKKGRRERYLNDIINIGK